MSFARNMSKNVGKNISTTSNSKYSQEIFYHDEQSVTDALKTTSKREIQKTAESNW